MLKKLKILLKWWLQPFFFYRLRVALILSYVPFKWSFRAAWGYAACYQDFYNDGWEPAAAVWEDVTNWD